MTEVMKRILAAVTNVTSGSTTVRSYDKSTYPVQISPNGSVGVDPSALVNSEEAQRQIGAVRELHKHVKSLK